MTDASSARGRRHGEPADRHDGHVGRGGPTEDLPAGNVRLRRYEIHGEPGDPAPAPGEEPLWDRFVTDAVTAFGSVQALMDAFGIASEANLYASLLDGWYGWDKNGDSHICVADFPDTPGNPAYIWNVIDNAARLPG